MDPILARDSRTRSIASDVFIGCVIVGGLYLGRQFLVPIVLAILLSFILSPLVVRLHRWGLGQAPSVCAVVLLAFLIVGGIATLIGMQMTQLAAGAQLRFVRSGLLGVGRGEDEIIPRALDGWHMRSSD